ncbi:hypothetical protein KAR91_08930 [Candidatus Pacearchaeota archaeon]|nr:hypothetical protein [Candidatus Pacearchaeota archaeon]
MIALNTPSPKEQLKKAIYEYNYYYHSSGGTDRRLPTIESAIRELLKYDPTLGPVDLPVTVQSTKTIS